MRCSRQGSDRGSASWFPAILQQLGAHKKQIVESRLDQATLRISSHFTTYYLSLLQAFAMSILIANPCVAHTYASPAWAEVHRLRSKKHLLTLQPTFKLVGNDKEREHRRKRRQFQHWKVVMEAALAALAHEIAVSKPKTPTRTARPKLTIVTNFDSSSPKFTSRSPTLCGEPQEYSKTSSTSSKSESVFQFTFTPPSAPRWPGLVEAPSVEEREILRIGRHKRRCVESPSDTESIVDATCGKRLLSRRSPAELASIRNKTMWKSRSRSSTL